METADEEPPIEKIGVFGEVIEQFTTVRTTHSALITLVGRQETRRTLVPFIELRLLQNGDDGDSEVPLANIIIPFENIAFMLNDISTDLEKHCNAIKEISWSSMGTPPDRVLFSIYHFNEAIKALSRSVEVLKSSNFDSPGESKPPRSRSARSVKPRGNNRPK